MDKLILVGNGFDLAHNLPTSYCNFLDYIWSNLTIDRKRFLKLVFLNEQYVLPNIAIKSYDDFVKNINELKEDYEFIFKKSDFGDRSFILESKDLNPHKPNVKVFEFRNKFFELITVSRVENWVDIENEYYKVLVGLVDGSNNTPIKSIENLNNEFNEIKDYLRNYLNENIEESFRFSSKKNSILDIVELFKYDSKYLSEKANLEYLLEFPKEMEKKLIDFDREMISYEENRILRVNAFQNLFLDFNYTSTIKTYVNKLNDLNMTKYGNSIHIQIHGSLTSKDNPINFGFGDEMDDHYRVIENTGNNKFLENIKSFMYLGNSNYRTLLNWIGEDKPFQVYVMGHSCGLSDRTLLNTIFEHPNCKSIKIFYHKGKGGDNYRELSMNISRHFNKKAQMREKLVPKNLCSELPQTGYFPRL